MKKTEPNPSQNQAMQTIRTEIDRVDTALLNLIAERMELAQAVRRAKLGVDVWRPSREQSQIRNLAEKAADISPDLVSRIWAELISASLTLQGPICLHISLSVDAVSARTLVRDRFGGAIPTRTYPTESAALAAAHIDPEGVAVLPAPGGMNNWWTALGPNGAASDMHILAALPRIGGNEWPNAVAVSKAERLPSGADQSVIYVEAGDIGAMKTVESIFENAGLNATLRAEIDDRRLYSVPEYIDDKDTRLQNLQTEFACVKIIGVLPKPIAAQTGKTL